MRQASNALLWRVASVALAAPVALLLIAACAYSIKAASHFDAWNSLWEAPGLLRSVGMTLWTGLASTLLAWGITAWLLSQAFGKPWWHRLVRSLSPLLATPHAAFAVGLVFLIAPSGWLLRAVSPWLTGWTQPPQIASSQDSFGLGFIAMLVFKEVPFLLWAAASNCSATTPAPAGSVRLGPRKRWATAVPKLFGACFGRSFLLACFGLCLLSWRTA
jgi:putative thiamine transport system permease protein